MPFLAPLIPLVMTELTALPAELGGLASGLGGILATPLATAMTGLGLSTDIAAPLAGFLSPEIIGGGIGELAGGTKGMEMGLLGGLGLGGGAGMLSDLVGNVGMDLGAGAGLAGNIGTTVANLAPAGIQLGQALTAPQATPTAAAPVKTITPTPAAPALALPGGGGASGLNLSGNTAPQVGPWKSFWGMTGSAPMQGTGGNNPLQGPAAATGQTASATQQQQFVPSP